MSSEKVQEAEVIPQEVIPVVGPLGLQEEHDISAVNSEAAEKLRSQMTPGEIAVWEYTWAKAVVKLQTLVAVSKELIEKLPEINELIEIWNLKVEAERKRYDEKRAEADKRIAELKKQRKGLQDIANQADIAYTTAKTNYDAKTALVKEHEDRKKSTALVEAEAISSTESKLVWAVRAILGTALAMSLGLIIGALNQYKPFSLPLMAFWFIGASVLVCSGSVVFWLAVNSAMVSEARRHPNTTVPPGNKWIWLMVLTMAFFSATDAATLMFGAFRLLSTTDSKMPLPILLLVCFIFVFPYLYYEASLGWRRGEKKVKDYMVTLAVDTEKLVCDYSPESLAEEHAALEKLRLLKDQSAQAVKTVNEDIANVNASVVMPVFWPPLKFGPGMYDSGNQNATPTWLAAVIDPPLNEDLARVRTDFLKAVEEAEQLEKQLCAAILARSITVEKPSGFFAKLVSQLRS